MSEARLYNVYIDIFGDDGLAGGKFSRNSQTGLLIFTNKAFSHCYSKMQANTE